MTAVVWEPFSTDLDRALYAGEWFIERVPADKQLSARIDEWKQLHADGWNVTALIAPDSRTVVALGCR